MKRIRKYPNSPNPLFEKWLQEWKDKAGDTLVKHAFEQALSSLRKYPLPLETGKDCYILNHFGAKLCAMLDKRLEIHNKLQNALSDSGQCISAEKKPEKPYIPKLGSAAYAILITLYKNTKKSNYPGFMYKNDIILQAQNYCPCPMKKKASEHYAGWNSMSSLISKNLILKKSNPAKYNLTDTGIALAMSLEKAREKINSDSSDEHEEISDNLKNFINFHNKSLSPPITSKSSLTQSKEKLDYLQSVKKSPAHLDLVENDLSEENESILIPYSLSKNVHKNIEENNEIIVIDDNNYNDGYTQQFQDNKISETNNELNNLILKETSYIKKSEADDVSFIKFCKENAESHNNKLQSEQTTKKKKKGVIKKNPSEDVSTKTFYLLPNNFDIILLVDTQETSRSNTKSNNYEKMSELDKNGVSYEIRNLKIGDFIWIARCRFTNRELTLPYIIERKRIDDFGSSIKDGRYHEQKYRLKESGIKNIIYMIESYGKNYHGAIPITSLFQAAMNTLVQDNFTIKFTKDHRDSLRYLSTMTKKLTEKFEAKELNSCNKNALPTNFDINEGSLRLMEFTEFNIAAKKTKNMTVQEMFIRQLQQLKGMSMNKALAIVQFYPTPRYLTEALIEGGENLLTNIIVPPTNRKLGQVISKTIYQLYTRRDLN